MSSQLRHTIIPAACLILIKDDAILLCRRFNTGYADGMYGLPGGHIEKNESFMHGLVREVREEINITIHSADLKMVHTMHRKSLKDREYMDIFFQASVWTGEIKNMESDKCDDIGWFKLNNLPDNIIESIRVALENIKKGIFFSESGY